MVKFHRLWKYILVYVIAMIASAIIANERIHQIDLAVFKKFFYNSYLSDYRENLNNSEEDEISKEIKNIIIFIDIPTTTDDDWLEKFRGQIADLLNIIDSKVNSTMSDLDKPVVILDIAFRRDTTGLRPLRKALSSLLIDKSIKVYAAYKMPDENEHPKYEEHEKDQNTKLYDRYFVNRLNTAFHNHTEVDGLLSYYSFERIDTVAIESLPVKVAKDYNRIDDETNLIDSIQYIVPLKLPFDPASRKDNYYVFSNDSTFTANNNFFKLNDTIDLSKKFIIIGSPNDQPEIGKKGAKKPVPGPYIVATALIDQLNGNKFTKPPYDNVVFQLVLILFFAFFVCLIFAVIYKYIKILQTRPYIIAVLSWVLGVAIFIGLGYLLLQFVVIRPMYPAVSMFWAALLAWHFTKQFLVLGIMEGSGEFDVFISYSRSKSDWVKTNLYNRLKEFNKPDGSKLKIFFDEDEIGIGEHFTTKYMRSIIDSKLFIPVMSEDYYKKNHCRNEMDIAIKRKVEKLIGIFMIAFDYKCVPEEFTHINFVDLSKSTDFMSLLENEIIKDDNKPLESKEDTKNMEPIKKSNEQVDTSQIVKQPEIKEEVEESLVRSILIDHRQSAKEEIDSRKIVLADGLDEDIGKGIIIINNGAGNLTISTKGVTLTLNGNNGKLEKKKKNNKEEKKKNKKSSKKKNKKAKKKKGKKS